MMMNHNDRWQQLSIKNPLLASLQKKTRSSLLLRPGIQQETYRADSVIHLAGDRCSGVEVILSGQVIIEHNEADGRYFVVAELGSSDLIGGQVVFSESPIYPMTLLATKTTTLLFISRDALLDLLRQEDNFLIAFFRLISDNAGRLSEKIRQTNRRSIRACLRAYIAIEIKKQGSRTIRLSVAKKTLAEQFGVQRTSLSRELQKMKNEGLVRYDAGSITWIGQDDP